MTKIRSQMSDVRCHRSEVRNLSSVLCLLSSVLCYLSSVICLLSVVFPVYAEELSRESVIVIDPGHGGTDQGAIGPAGLIEKEVVLDMAKRLKRCLQIRAPSLTVLLTREEDLSLSLRERKWLANSKGAELFISLHTNGSPTKNVEGCEIWYFAPQIWEIINPETRTHLQDIEGQRIIKKSQRVADLVSQNLPANLKRRVRRGVLVLLDDLKVPAVLFEMGFITSPADEERLKNEDFKEEVVRGLAEAIIKYLSRE